MKVRCRCGSRSFNLEVLEEGLQLRCTKCKKDFITDFGPRILERIFKTVTGKILGQTDMARFWGG